MLAYVVIREGLTVLLGFGGDATIAALSPDSYFSFLIAMLIIFGVSFELPLLLIMLNQIGHGVQRQAGQVAPVFDLRDGRLRRAGGSGQRPDHHAARWPSRWCLLYELSVQVTRIHDKRTGQAAGRLAANCPTTRRPRCPIRRRDPAPRSSTTCEVQPVAAAWPIPTPEPAADPADGPADRRVDDLGDAT